MTNAKKTIVSWLFLSPLVVVILFPFAVMISTAIKPRAEILTFPPVWLPKNIRLQNFVDMWHAVGFGQALINSALVSGAATVLCLLIAIPAAYATAWTRFRGKRLFRQFLLITQMLSPVVLVLGIFRLMVTLGLVDKLWALVLAYAAFNLAFAIWMLQAYFGTIPKEQKRRHALMALLCCRGCEWCCCHWLHRRWVLRLSSFFCIAGTNLFWR